MDTAGSWDVQQHWMQDDETHGGGGDTSNLYHLSRHVLGLSVV